MKLQPTLYVDIQSLYLLASAFSLLYEFASFRLFVSGSTVNTRITIYCIATQPPCSLPAALQTISTPLHYDV